MFTKPVKCGQDGCMRTFRYPKALVRHIESDHVIVSNDEFIDDAICSESIEEGGDDQHPILDAEEDMTEEDFSMKITNSVTLFLAKMKASSSVVQSTIDHVVSNSQELFSDIIGGLKFKTEQYLNSENITPDDPERKNLMTIFDKSANVFIDGDTAYK